jgi:hypothetical protein
MCPPPLPWLSDDLLTAAYSVCIISVYRMFTLRAGVISQDPTWDNIGAAIWSCIELNVAIITSSIPTLRPLFNRLLPGFGLSSAKTDRATYLRYGSASGGVRSGTKSATARVKQMQSTSIEELTLDDMSPSPSGSVVTGVYANATADHERHFPPKGKDEGHIFMKTEISVNTGSRGVAR